MSPPSDCGLPSDIRPVEFEPDVHAALWGEEEWLVSAHPRSPGRIVGSGGATLRDICPSFPLLVKRISARRSLSVQVHPSEATAAVVGGEPKTEMWCVLEAGPIFAGFRPGVTAADVERAVHDGSFESILVRFDAKPGECYFIPGGLVHAIGAGTSVYEVQQSSDTTFRLYDWGRVGADGRPRKLHVKEALAALDLSLPPPVPEPAVSCRYFDFAKMPEGEVAASPHWRVVYTPSTRASFLLPPGAVAETHAPSFLTTVRGFAREPQPWNIQGRAL